MPLCSRLVCAGIVAATMALTAPMALADVIDGDWCSKDGRAFTIDRERIVTPLGDATTGRYTRHSFDYVGPWSAAGATQPIMMRLLNEETVQIQVEGAVEIWHRCSPVS